MPAPPATDPGRNISTESRSRPADRLRIRIFEDAPAFRDALLHVLRVDPSRRAAPERFLETAARDDFSPCSAGSEGFRTRQARAFPTALDQGCIRGRRTRLSRRDDRIPGLREARDRHRAGNASSCCRRDSRRCSTVGSTVPSRKAKLSALHSYTQFENVPVPSAGREFRAMMFHPFQADAPEFGFCE